jgi:hypothetical protein
VEQLRPGDVPLTDRGRTQVGGEQAQHRHGPPDRPGAALVPAGRQEVERHRGADGQVDRVAPHRQRHARRHDHQEHRLGATVPGHQRQGRRRGQGHGAGIETARPLERPEAPMVEQGQRDPEGGERHRHVDRPSPRPDPDHERPAHSADGGHASDDIPHLGPDRPPIGGRASTSGGRSARCEVVLGGGVGVAGVAGGAGVQQAGLPGEGVVPTAQRGSDTAYCFGPLGVGPVVGGVHGR